MAGINRETGQVLDGLDHAIQSVRVILTTPLATRVMRREFGAGVIELLGRSITPARMLLWQQLVSTAIDLWEPRFAVKRVLVSGSADELRLGTAGVVIEADYRPRGHLGDLRVERLVNFSL